MCYHGNHFCNPEKWGSKSGFHGIMLQTNLTLLLLKACITGIEGSSTSDGSTDTGMEVSVSVDISYTPSLPL